jgi:hypothetical protein
MRKMKVPWHSPQWELAVHDAHDLQRRRDECAYKGVKNPQW